jgi:hypothetical protein
MLSGELDTAMWFNDELMFDRLRAEFAVFFDDLINDACAGSRTAAAI